MNYELEAHSYVGGRKEMEMEKKNGGENMGEGGQILEGQKGKGW